jgi:hypothetical protein
MVLSFPVWVDGLQVRLDERKEPGRRASNLKWLYVVLC